MKIEDLKVGDKIKYNVPHYAPYEEGEGVITKLDKIFVVINSNASFWVGYIVSKLEPQYKEIPIDKPLNWTFEVKGEDTKCNFEKVELRTNEAYGKFKNGKTYIVTIQEK
jgi:hypothetical protein